MDSKEVWAKCQQCGTELKEGDKVCPKCGSTKKVFDEKASVAIGIKSTTEAEHEAPWSSKSYTILAIIIALFFGVLFVVIGPLPSLAIRIGIAATIIIIVLVILFNNKVRYSLIMFIRRLDSKLTARKKYRGK